MKVNDKELLDYALSNATMEGRLHHKKLGGNLAVGFKEQLFKLRGNILFYFNIPDGKMHIDRKPAGALILENCTTSYEAVGETPFSFSITFRDEVDRKHLFSGRSEEYILKWVQALKSSSYEFWRARLLMLQIKLSSITGQDPLLMYHRSEGSKLPLTIAIEEGSPRKKNRERSNKTSFKSYVGSAIPEKTPVNALEELHFDDNFFGNSLQAIGSKVSENSTSNSVETYGSAGVEKNVEKSRQRSPEITSIIPRPRPARPPRASKMEPPAKNLIDF